MSTEPNPEDTVLARLTRLERQAGITSERRSLTGDRINVLSDRLAGVEHRAGDILRAIENLRTDAITRVDMARDEAAQRHDTLFGAIADIRSRLI